MNHELQVNVSENERLPLREAMGDIQRSVGAYYGATARGTDLGDPVRTFLLKAQTLNDRFANSVRDSRSYRDLFIAPRHTSADLVDAVRYARNIDQHVLHIVQPRASTLIGGELGMRIYAYWEDIPSDAHEKLQSRTAKLKPAYDTYLRGEEVTKTMLAVLRFYAAIAPEIVHRDDRGEWTGFPLMSQPGVDTPLHPEEPTDTVAARSWLNGRRPNGDMRIVCAQLICGDTCYLVGLTFTGRLSYAHFAETIEQVSQDIDFGFPYMLGDVSQNLEDVSVQFPQARQGPVLISRTDIDSWALPMAKAEEAENWYSPLNGDDMYPPFAAEDWRRIIRTEQSDLYPESMRYESRRARRLNALVPSV